MTFKQPLLGKRILITRPGSSAQTFADKLRKIGAAPIILPMLEIKDPDSWHELDTAIAELEQYSWLVFASAQAVAAFADRLKLLHKCTKAMPTIAVIGATTAKAINKCGFTAKYCPEKFIAEEFVHTFPGYPDKLEGINILWPRGNLGRTYIAEHLRKAGATVNIVPAYKSKTPETDKQLCLQLRELFQDKNVDVITLASSQTAINFAKLLLAAFLPLENNGSSDFISSNSEILPMTANEARSILKTTLQDILIVTIGPETTKGALNYLGRVDLEAREHNIDGLIEVLIEHYTL